MLVALSRWRAAVNLQPNSLATQDEILHRIASDQGREVIRRPRDKVSGRFVESGESLEIGVGSQNR
jgi:hypothetical protein